MPRNNCELVYLALGSNLGDKAENLQKAIGEISDRIGPIVVASSVYETEPWGYHSPHSFLNQVVAVKTTYSPQRLLQLTQNIEKSLGRAHKTIDQYRDRIIDIDLILYGTLILDSPKLILPHPRFHLRKFVLEPLCEIAPELMHPVLKKNMKAILSDFSDMTSV
ncbi:MAG: 2-amino-4-hydroxy-6-hydroxymethyldihydropteridine diphosphokinase [Dysgonamonadaceae bacterium]|jgi:2-amino-4-hydroxy-6-hydroxymethyldihydropteridine diphosphokinase|nr:2-amino-4-hydroxy-6-hydroxymethyldihydropteridine diphosphokinase [Dysgonamonadaceae bacterium]